MTTPPEPCPVCWAFAARPTHDTELVEAWACDACGTKWACTVVNPRPFVDALAAAVSARRLAAEVLELAELAQQRVAADTDP